MSARTELLAGWEVPVEVVREVPVQVTDRIILHPLAAKRLALLLTRVVKEYEARFGALPGPGA